MVQKLTVSEMKSKVMTMAHTNFNSKYNKNSWGACLRKAWDTVKQLIKVGSIKIRKQVKYFETMEQLRKSIVRVDYGNVDPYTMGYGHGNGCYCGD